MSDVAHGNDPFLGSLLYTVGLGVGAIIRYQFVAYWGLWFGGGWLISAGETKMQD